MKANVEKFKLSVLNDLDKSQTKNKDLIDEAMKTFSVKLNEKTESASEKLVKSLEHINTVEEKLESHVQDMKNALTSSHDNLQKQVFDTAKKIQSKLEKSTEANLESHLRKLKDETTSNYMTKISFNEKYNELNGKLNTNANLQKNIQSLGRHSKQFVVNSFFNPHGISFRNNRDFQKSC